MTLPLPRPLTLLTLAFGIAITACSPLDKDNSNSDAADQSSPLASLKDDKQKVSWIIGNNIGGQLSPLKDEIDFKTLMRAVQEQVEGKAKTLDQNEVTEIMSAFETRMQTKQAEEMQALADKNSEEGRAFFESNGQKPGVTATETGLQYEVLSEGTGKKPEPMDTVRVHYHGTFLNGEVFDSSRERGEPVQLNLDGVIPGWREGLLLMPVGSKYRLWVPATLAYGQTGTPGGPIGPNTTLVFEVELLEIVDAQ